MRNNLLSLNRSNVRWITGRIVGLPSPNALYGRFKFGLCSTCPNPKNGGISKSIRANCFDVLLILSQGTKIQSVRK